MSFLTSIVTSALICRICHVATQTKLSKLLLLLKGIIDPILLGVKEEEEALKRRRRGSHMRVMWMRVRHVLQGLSKESVAWHNWSVGVQLTFRSICHSAYRLLIHSQDGPPPCRPSEFPAAESDWMVTSQMGWEWSARLLRKNTRVDRRGLTQYKYRVLGLSQFWDLRIDSTVAVPFPGKRLDFCPSIDLFYLYGVNSLLMNHDSSFAAIDPALVQTRAGAQLSRPSIHPAVWRARSCSLPGAWRRSICSSYLHNFGGPSVRPTMAGEREQGRDLAGLRRLCYFCWFFHGLFVMQVAPLILAAGVKFNIDLGFLTQVTCWK